jgi:hypothetical protein
MENVKSSRRMLPELGDYPDNQRGVGSLSVWNPYVKCETLPSSSFLPMLPTNPQVEVTRRRAYEKFKKDFYELLEEKLQKPLKIKLPIPSLLEKWQMDSKLEEFQAAEKYSDQKAQTAATSQQILASSAEISRLVRDQHGWIDPILLSTRTASASFGQACEFEYTRCWKDQNKGSNEEQFQQALSKLTKTLKPLKKAVQKLIKDAMEYFEEQISSKMLSQSSLKRPKIKRDTERDQITVAHYGLSFSLHVAHYTKLQRLFDRAASQACFEDALFCLLCRYDMLQGAGLQAALPGSVHDVLLQHLECRMESFASPLNCRNQNFCSAFELDRLFGSVGSFFSCQFETGCYQANPPFCEILIASMCKRINALLEQQKQEPLMFVIFVPVWKAASGYQLLLESNYLTKHIVFDQGRHYYTEGSQYRRKESFRVASFDTSVFFYQNEAAQHKWPVSQCLLDDLQRAFTTDPSIASTNIQPSAEPATKVPAAKQAESTTATKGSSEETDTAIRSNHKKTKRKPTGKKRTLTDKEEHKAQLDILQSMGLAEDDHQGTVDFTKKSPGKEQNKKKRKK